MLPTTQEYKISLMIGQDSFRTLQGVEVIPNPNYPDEPWYSTGGLAIVFKLKLKDKLYALKCFYTEANERQERLGLIAAYLKQNPSPYFVDFTYLENELWVQTANDEGQGYPVVLMEWVEGKTLDNYLEQICTQNNTPALKNLYFQFCNLAWWLQQQPIAHGDIKHDNLIVTPDGKLKLIDYDGVFVPALRGRKANEMGSPCYQHPKRDAYFFDKNLDDFSLLVLQITLLALQHQPKLFTEHYNGDGIMLKDTDYQNFAQSPIKTILWQLPEVKIPLLLSQIQGNINNLSAIDLAPLLQDVAWINWLVDGQKDDKLVFERYKISSEYSSKDKLIEKFKDNYLDNTINSFENIIETKVAPSIKTMGVKEFMQYMDFISVVKLIRINVNGYPYITFVNSKNEAENIYFSEDAAKLVTEGQLIEKGFLNQFKIGELIINGNLRYKLITQGDSLIACQL